MALPNNHFADISRQRIGPHNCQSVIFYASVLAGLTNLAIISFFRPYRRLLKVCENPFFFLCGP
jgi:hypothetical protein